MQNHQRLKTETDHLTKSANDLRPQTSQPHSKPILLQKPQNNFFADVVQASQGGLSQYQSQGQQQKPRKSSSNAQQQQQVSYDAYNKLMQQLIKESKQKSTSTTQKQSSYRKNSASSRTRTKSQQE